MVALDKYKDGYEFCYATNVSEWHEWLEKNHSQKSGVWLVYYKPASGQKRVSYSDAVDEAICFGWIDSRPNKLDNLKSIQLFAPRNPKSNWSSINKERVKRLTAEGRMTEAGLAVVKAAQNNGSWNALNEVEEMIVPDDLLKELKRVPRALTNFNAFPRSSKRNILEWIMNAKQVETRAKRIAETAKLAAENIRANHYRQPKQH